MKPPRLPAGVRRLIARRLATPHRPAAHPVRRRTCIYKVDRIGDFVLALGAVRRLIAHYGAADCRLIVSESSAPLAAAEFPDVARWELPASAAGVWRDIRPLHRQLAPAWAGEQFEHLVCLRHVRTLYRDLTLSWLHAAHWHGLGPRPGRHELLTHDGHAPAAGYPHAAAAPWSRELQAHRQVAEQVTGRPADWDAIQPRLQSVHPTNGPAWVFCPFANDRLRDYPVNQWIAAWREAALPRAPVHVLGTRDRATELGALADGLRREAGFPDVEVACELTTMGFMARLAAARGVIAVESAAAHVATALDKPAVIILGGGHFGWLSPWGDQVRQRWLTRQMPCFECHWDCEFDTVRCIVEQTAGSVARAMREVLP